MRRFATYIMMLIIMSAASPAQQNTTIDLTVRADKPGASIAPTMWGVMIEDLNFSVDGGLYAELVKNRSFEFPDPMTGWRQTAPGDIEILTSNPFGAAQPHYLRMTAGASVSNEGFRGIGARAHEGYVFTARIRAASGHPILRLELVGSDGHQLAAAKVKRIFPGWDKYTAVLQPSATDAKARLNLIVEGTGAADLDQVSLFPRRTWRNRPNGLRADLMQMIADLKPGFVKFPGGFATEGRGLDSRYPWKQTIGDIAERKPASNPWSKFSPRPLPDYHQSFGLGFYEYFQLSEDLGAAPLPVLNPGMAANFTGQTVPLDQLGLYIQEARDLIEFANGSPDSEWGAKRTAMGHLKSFGLKMLRIGNEQSGSGYIERYRKFAAALAAHSEIILIGGAGPTPKGADFDSTMQALRGMKTAIVDIHSHNQPDWFYTAATRFDAVDRDGPKIMMGEWAAHSEPGLINANNHNNLAMALAEAAFMTGLERNANLVVMSCYAPLLANADAWQWKPSLIWFDSLRVFGTPSYYAQMLFGQNRGDVVLPIQSTSGLHKLYTSAIRDTKRSEIIVKIVNPSPEKGIVRIALAGARIVAPGRVTVLTSANPADENSFAAPKKVFPTSEKISAADMMLNYTVKPNSLTVVRLPVR